MPFEYAYGGRQICNSRLDQPRMVPEPWSEPRGGLGWTLVQSKVHAEHSVRVGVCNILLQRVQSVVPISKGVQQRLNALLFGDR